MLNETNFITENEAAITVDAVTAKVGKERRAPVSEAAKAAPALVPMKSDVENGVLPLDMLCRAADNVRTRGTDEADGIPALAELIYAFGLINPLSIVDKTEGDDFRFPVAAGDRRFRALLLLASQGRIRMDEPIDVRRFTSKDALAVSLAENSGRLEMHPVDQFEAFRKLVEIEGKTMDEVADAYGVSALTVRRRLSLSKVAPELLALFREDGIAQDQLQVLALVEDHATQVHIWHSAPSYNRSAYNLRSMVLAAEVSAKDHRARFVGVEAYVAAGGTLRSDLFSDDDSTYLEDVTLLDRLFAEKMEGEVARLTAEGWAWVEVANDLHGLYAFHRTAPTLRDMTAEEARQMAVLDARMAELDAKLNEISDQADESGDDDGTLYELQEATEEEREALEAQCNAIDEQRKEFTAAARAISGVRICAASGSLAMAAGLIRHADFVLQPAATSGEGDGSDDREDLEDEERDHDRDAAVLINGVHVEVSRYAGVGRGGHSGGASNTPKVKPEFSEKVISDLSAHRTGAMQAALLENQHVALATLVLSMLSREERGDGYYRHAVPAQVQTTSCTHSILQKATGYSTSRAGLAMAEAEAHMHTLLQVEDGDAASDEGVFGRLLNLGDDDLLTLLTYLTARTVDVIGPRSAEPSYADALADALHLDMAEYWKAGNDNFFVHVPKAKAIEAVTEAVSVKDAEPLAKMKKGEAAKAAGTLVSATRWLPVPLLPLAKKVDAPAVADRSED